MITTRALAEPLWAADEAAAATGGVAQGTWAATGVSIDSRTVAPGDLFVALRGLNHDGHAYVGRALSAGAAAAVVEQAALAEGLADVPGDAPLLVVRDGMDALEALGRFARLRTKATVIGVTGSVGKTGTKEALKLACDAHGPTAATLGNLNNHIGVPLTLARLPTDLRFAVIEMGMNHANEIRPLSRMAKPDVSIITTVTDAHLENFRDETGIADAKAEIFDGMEPSGTAVLNRDNPHCPRLVAHARTAGLGRIWTFGQHDKCDARLLDTSLHTTCSAVHAIIRGDVISYSLPIPGRHWVDNSLAVLLAMRAVGGDITVAARALLGLRAGAGRGQRSVVERPDGTRFAVIDESYNASPAAVRAALSVLAASTVQTGGRRVLVLGDMLELGDAAARLHAGLAETIAAAGIDRVHTCGPLSRHLHDALPSAVRGHWAKDSAALVDPVAADVRPGDAVLVKGSLGSRMQPVVAALLSLGRATDPGDPPAASGMPTPNRNASTADSKASPGQGRRRRSRAANGQ